ncbi:inactive peptidyl-prolyl cis-trans isomerase FKBP6-like [Anneissia japonica]|uniref:inactive peptidyl-prolyl cis-trans isomerase FKBP6-like n=1 Tax=Anneissia japonica TaxID=1529436 RepID=UPI0014257469|nr:inactive peptidyl-prolyl cis-trans isomerase FKBP6-like [Anneissia japonica]XP_033123345.1 inactive peptidyl-prolyl cis-trans isomerase FKBP6-like [Anneissia japonica]
MDQPESVDFNDLKIYDNDAQEFMVPLKECVDMEELLKEDSKGCEFEIDEDQLPPNLQGENNFFDNEDIFKNLTRASLLKGHDDDASSGDDDLSFDKVGLKMEDITKDGGVKKKIIKQGTGEIVTSGVSVRVHYNGFLEFSDEPYDSSRLRNKPQHFKLGEGEVIPGMDIAVSTMKKGEMSQFLIQSAYAFGKKGVPPRIPEDATILFEIELLHFTDDCITDNPGKDADWKEVLKVVNSHRQMGNDLFRSNAIHKAFNKYQKAYRLLEDARLKNEFEEEEMKAVMLKVCLNMSLSSFKLGNSPRAVTFANKAIAIDAKNAKAHFRKGQALLHLSDFSRARGSLKTAQKLAPNDGSIVKELHKLEKACKTFKTLEKDMCSRMFMKSKAKPNEDSKVEKEKETETVCAKSFEDQVNESLSAFEADESTCKVFPSSTLSTSEKEFILKKAESLGLRVKTCEESTGYDVIRVTKPQYD